MKILHKHETTSLITNKVRKVLLIGVENGVYTVWANYDDHQQICNTGKSLREACAWFLRRGDENLVSIDEALNWETCESAIRLEKLINKREA